MPDFRFSMTGEPIEDKADYVSSEKIYFNNINFDNNQWEQNRPDELDKLSACVHQDNKMGSVFRKKAQVEKKYNQPLVADYPLELAKDVLMCSPVMKSYHVHLHPYDFSRVPYMTYKQTKTVSSSY